MCRLGAWTVVVAFAWSVGPVGAEAQGRQRVGAVAPPAPLTEALRTALGPWQIDVIELPPPVPGSSMPASADEGRSLARAHGTAAVIWLSETAEGHALWVYDARADRVIARRILARTPLDDAAAAAIALSVKTLLRHSLVVPPAERFGAQPLRPGRAGRDAAAPPGDGGGFALEPGGGVRLGPLLPVRPEARVHLTAAWTLAGLEGRVALALDLESGPGRAIEAPLLAATVFDAGAAICARLQMQLAADVRAGVEAGAGAHLIRIDGVVRNVPHAASATRIDPVARAGASLELRWVPTLVLGVRATMAYWIRRQHFLVQRTLVAEMSPWGVELGLFVTSWVR